MGSCKRLLDAMWLMLNKREPEDYVISMGPFYLRDFAKLAFEFFDLDISKICKS